MKIIPTRCQVIKAVLPAFLNLLLCIPVPAQMVSHAQFNFRGFSTRINDAASDENNNHLLVGSIRVADEKEANRDADINRIFNLKEDADDDDRGIMILTDKNYKILRIAKSFTGEKVIYDRNTGKFIVGANFYDYPRENDFSFRAWHPVVILTGADLKGKAYHLQKPYSCILTNMAICNDGLLLFTRSDAGRTDDRSKSGEKAEIIRVSPSRSHTEGLLKINVLDPVSTLISPHDDIGRLSFSDLSKTGDSYYFTTSNLDQSRLASTHHLYELTNDRLVEILSFPDYLKWASGGSGWININGFMVSAEKEFTFLTHQAAASKEMLFSRTDADFNRLLSQKISLNYYADFNRMLVLPDERIIILSVNPQENWSYFLYGPDMELIKETDSGISKNYYPSLLKEAGAGSIACFFYLKQVSRKDCVWQVVDLK